MSNKNSKAVIKTSSGNTEQISISDKVMQGRVLGGHICTTTMDKLCKLVYKDKNLVYKYKGNVEVPPLEMVDDVITVSKCESTSVALNQTVNSFVKLKKLTLSKHKCSKIHIENNSKVFPEHKVHSETMETSNKEKYLVDFVTD